MPPPEKPCARQPISPMRNSSGRDRLAPLEAGGGALRRRHHAGHRRPDRSVRSARSDRAAVRARRARTAQRRRKATIRSATMRTARSKASCTAIPTGCCSSSSMSARSIAGSASAARWSGRGGAGCRRRRSTRRSTTSRNHPEIWEVILTGGDPLVLSARRLKDVVTRLAAIAHVKVIRVHTRVPVAAPGTGHGGAGARAAHRQGDLRRAARQSSARADRASARRLRAPGRCRHSDADRSRCCCAASTTMPRRSAR